MKSLILSIACGLLLPTAFCQTDPLFHLGRLISDSSTLTKTEYTTTLPSILKSTNKIEIRFINDPSFSRSDLIVLSYNDKWTIKHCYFDPKTKNVLQSNITTINADTLFNKLVSNNIFSLPDENDFKIAEWEYYPKTDEFLLDPATICDGVCYFIEFKVGPYSRQYGYCNPRSKFKMFPNIHELADFCNIVDIFKALTK